MRAVHITEVGAPPTVVDTEEPTPGDDEVVVELVAAALNPADLAVAGGMFPAGHPPLPYSPGMEAVGTVDGRTVLAYGGGLGVFESGTLAERFTAPRSALIDLPDGVDPEVAAALATAGLAGWLAVTWKANTQPGETVLVLGATGTTGTVAVHAAKAAGAGRVVAAGRDPERLSRLDGVADATVELGGDDMAARLQEACAPGADVVFDPLWGAPLAAALGACALDARVVHIGAGAGQTAELASGLFRGKRLTLMGYTNLAVPRDVAVAAYLDMVGRSIRGELSIDVTAVSIDRVAEAWDGTRAGGTKYVVTPA